MQRTPSDTSTSSKRTRLLLLRGLAKRYSKKDLVSLLRPFGVVMDCMVVHGRGKAFVEMAEEDAGRVLVQSTSETGLFMRNNTSSTARRVRVALDPTRSRLTRDRSSDTRVRYEVKRCLADISKTIVKNIAEFNRLNRKRRRKEWHTLVNRASVSDSSRKDVCWDYVVSGGHCSRGSVCALSHRTDVGFHLVPASRRVLTCEDSFVALNENTAHKRIVNDALVCLTKDLSNRRALVLDGPGARTAKALVCSSRTSDDIVVPNICSQTYTSIQKTGVCRPFYGSLRVYMDGHPTDTYGLAYFDYCCRLHAGKRQIEKSPIADLKRLFELKMLDEHGAILCVTLRNEDEKEGTGDSDDDVALPTGILTRSPEMRAFNAPQNLRHLVCKFAALAGYVAVPHPSFYHYGRMYTEFFWVSGPSHIGKYCGLDAVRGVENFLPPRKYDESD